MTDQWAVAVIGGGAAGLAAACSAAAAGCRTVILERGARVGRKLLVTGNGRCNLTFCGTETDCYFSETPERAAAIRGRCTPADVLGFFRSIGLLTRTDGAGRVYPYSEQASSVADVLRVACKRNGAVEQCGFDVEEIVPVRGGFRIRAADGTVAAARTVIVACGGPAAPANGGTDSGLRLMRALGHEIVPVRPALTVLRTDEARVRPLKGLRVKCAVTLLHGGSPLRHEVGELQFGDGQLSGVCIFQLSRLAAQASADPAKWAVAVDLLPDQDGDTAAFLAARAQTLRGCPAESAFLGLFHKRIGLELLRGIPNIAHRTVGDFSAAEWRMLAQRCRAWTFPVYGTGGFAAAQVTAGGVRLTELTEKLESIRVPGLFACGEVLDADGICGGYNLQWAWSTGLQAGRNAAVRCGKPEGKWHDFSV